MPNEREKRKREEICSGIAAAVSSLLWLACVVVGVLADTDGQCIHDLRFGELHFILTA